VCAGARGVGGDSIGKPAQSLTVEKGRLSATFGIAKKSELSSVYSRAIVLGYSYGKRVTTMSNFIVT
jgi:hypothetical protein